MGRSEGAVRVLIHRAPARRCADRDGRAADRRPAPRPTRSHPARRLPRLDARHRRAAGRTGRSSRRRPTPSLEVDGRHPAPTAAAASTLVPASRSGSPLGCATRLAGSDLSDQDRAWASPCSHSRSATMPMTDSRRANARDVAGRRSLVGGAIASACHRSRSRSPAPWLVVWRRAAAATPGVVA